VLRNASHAYVLVDSEKFGKDSFIRYAALSEAEKILTDAGIPEDLLQSFMDAGARIEVESASRKSGKGGE
jgi:DeoR/GlpR family transcriptional regulator of sugar metabolism